jgi:hypothetical protein
MQRQFDDAVSLTPESVFLEWVLCQSTRCNTISEGETGDRRRRRATSPHDACLTAYISSDFVPCGRDQIPVPLACCCRQNQLSIENARCECEGAICL